MIFQDRSIQCSDCGAPFNLTVAEQEFSQSNGYTSEPKLCPSCHAAKKMKRYGDGNYSYRFSSWR